MTVSIYDLLFGVRRYAPTGYRASGDWLRAVPGEHLLEIVCLDYRAVSGDQNAAVTLSRVMVALLTAERGVSPPQLESVEQGITFVQSLAPAAKLEMMRRQGTATVDPPLRSIFNPGDSFVTFTTTDQKEPA